MILDLKLLFNQEGKSLPLDYEFDLRNVELSGRYPIQTPVRITGEILNKTGIVRIEAKIFVEMTAECDRCGEMTVKSFSVPVERVIVSSCENEDDELMVLPDYKLDLYELCLTEVVLNIPAKHLCSEACKGVCQKCGKNLNLGDCGCDKTEIDPRLAALKDLLN